MNQPRDAQSISISLHPCTQPEAEFNSRKEDDGISRILEHGRLILSRSHWLTKWVPLGSKAFFSLNCHSRRSWETK